MNVEKINENMQTGEFPNKDEILDVINSDLDNLSLNIMSELSDEMGVYRIEAETEEKDSEGYKREYTYSRKSKKTQEELEPKIHVAYIESEDDFPIWAEEISKIV